MSCPKLAEGDIVRVTRVDDCGAPVEGADNAYVDECWASVLMSPNVEAGTDIKFKAMNGQSCGAKRGCPTFNWFDVTGTFFSASPELIEIMTGQPVYDGYDGEPIGWSDGSVACASGFALEVWQNVIGEDCVVGDDGLWFYWLLMWVTNGVIGDVTVNDGGTTFTLTGTTRANGGWSLGPWDVLDDSGVASPLPTVLPSTQHRLGVLTTIAPPTASCEYVLVPPNNTPGS